MMKQDNSIGECTVRRDGDTVTIVQADPHIHVQTTFLDQAIFDPTDALWMDYSNEQTCFEQHEHSNLECFRLRAIMHIKGVNREVLYRITPHPERTDVYVGRWPD